MVRHDVQWSRALVDISTTLSLEKKGSIYPFYKQENAFDVRQDATFSGSVMLDTPQRLMDTLLSLLEQKAVNFVRP